MIADDDAYQTLLSSEPAVVRDLAAFVARFIREEIDDLAELDEATVLDAFGYWGVSGSSQAYMDCVTGKRR